MRCVLAVACFFLALPAARADTYLVLPFFNTSKSANLNWIGESLAETLRESLSSEGLITLDRDEVAIHGTTRAMRASVGTAASYGCIRMLNEDVVDLYERVNVGADVMMVP